MTAKNAKLPFWLTTIDAYAASFGNLPTLARVAVIPYCLAYAAGFSAGFVAAFTGYGDQLADPFSSWNVAAWLIQAIILSIFAVAWHRFVLLGPSIPRTKLGIDVTRREIVFIAYAFIIGVILWGPYLIGLIRRPPSFDWLTIALLLWPVYILPVVARLSLVFPAAAIERRISFSQAWTMTRGSAWRLTGVLFLCGLPFSILYQLVFPLLLDAAGGTLWVLLVEMAQLILICLHIAVAAAVLSLTYRWISQKAMSR